MTPLSTLRHRLAPRHGVRGIVAGFLRKQSGSAALEFALVAGPFIALTLALLQVGLIYFAQEALESTVEQSARLVLTGQVTNANTSQTDFRNLKLCPNSPGLFTCSSFMIDLQPAPSLSNADVTTPTITYDGSGNITNTWQYDTGAPNDIMVLRVMYPWPVYLGPLALNFGNMQNNNLLLMATAVFKNEPPH
jgi:Flp pilus assembly protein TadG